MTSAQSRYDTSSVQRGCCVLCPSALPEHPPPPLRARPQSYSFLVKHSFLWWASYSTLQPRWVHGPYMQVLHALCARSVGEAFATYCPDLVVSVHPLLQHVPLRVLRSRVKAGLQPPAAFATVVTDFTTCHNTWFHKGVRAAWLEGNCTVKAFRLRLRVEAAAARIAPLACGCMRPPGLC